MSIMEVNLAVNANANKQAEFERGKRMHFTASVNFKNDPGVPDNKLSEPKAGIWYSERTDRERDYWK